jgi:hypothetical protein
MFFYQLTSSIKENPRLRAAAEELKKRGVKVGDAVSEALKTMEESELARAVRLFTFTDRRRLLFLTLCRYPERRQPSLPLLPLQQSPSVTPRRTRPSRRHSSMHSTILALLSMPVLRKRRRGGHVDSCALPRRAKRGASRRVSSLTPSTYL